MVWVKKLLVEAHPSIFLALKLLFNVFFIYGYVPERFAKCLVIPLHKKHGLDINAASCCRPITIVPIIGKLFESCLYPVLDPFCTSHTNQFGFVVYGGTMQQGNLSRAVYC